MVDVGPKDWSEGRARLAGTLAHAALILDRVSRFLGPEIIGPIQVPHAVVGKISGGNLVPAELRIHFLSPPRFDVAEAILSGFFQGIHLLMSGHVDVTWAGCADHDDCLATPALGHACWVSRGRPLGRLDDVHDQRVKDWTREFRRERRRLAPKKPKTSKGKPCKRRKRTAHP